MRIEWSSKAYRDAISIINYISEDDPVAALKLIERIEYNLQALKKFPQMGRIVPELNSKSIREIIVDDFYRVIYEVKSDIILVTTIRHTRRKPTP